MKQLRHHWNLLLMILFLSTFLAGCMTRTASTEQNLTSSATQGQPDSRLTVRFLDVGQADAALIECDGHYMLIDGGNKDDSSLLYTLLHDNGITRLDLVIGTHADEDHIGGLSGALYFAEADLVLCSTTDYDSDAFQDFKKYADLRGGGIHVPQAGDSYALGDALVEILAVNSGTDSNDSSIVTKITYRETSFLFTGDAERATEHFLLTSEAALQSTVLKVAHHGSEYSSSSDFLDAVLPEYAVISVGADNTYGHPASKTLQRLESVGAKIFRTDQSGTITFYSDGYTVTRKTESDATANRSFPDESTQTLEETPDSGSDSNSANKTEVRYVFNIRSKKFHKPSCESVVKMNQTNRLDFTGTREEAIALDYTPCGSCKP